jgi:protease IV
MSKFLIGLLTGIILTGILLVIVGLSAVTFRDRPPSIAPGSTLVLDLEGEIPERAPVEYPIPFLGGHGKPTVENVWTALRKAAVDSRIKAVVLMPGNLDAGWGKLQEIRSNLVQFRKSGKPLYAYLKAPGVREYYLATAAERIYLTPEDFLDLKGLRFELMYFKNTLDKLGVEVEIQHAGKYKDFGDTFTRTSMSPETREVLSSIIDDLYTHLIATVAEGRRKTPEAVRALLDRGPFLASQVTATGLVDAVKFEDEMYAELEKRLAAGEIKKVTLHDYIRIPAAPLGLEGPNRVALIAGQGGISRGGSGDGLTEESGLTSASFIKILRRVGSDAGIKGVVVRVDSPGGEVTASDEIWREMILLSRKKPTVISMSDVAASGGYYIAMTGDPVLAYPGTFTGSIGVVFGKPTLRGLYDKLGITKESLTRGRFADIDSDYKPFEPEARAKVQEGIDQSYRAFVSKVAEGRHRRYEEIEPLAQGRVWLGSQAKQRGLVDELGGLDRAFELLKQRAKIPANQKLTIVTYPPRRGVWDLLFSEPEALAKTAFDFLRRSSGNVLSETWESQAWQVRMLLEGGYLRIMPYSLRVY